MALCAGLMTGVYAAFSSFIMLSEGEIWQTGTGSRSSGNHSEIKANVLRVLA